MGSGSRLVRLVIGAVIVLLSACGEDEERLIVEPADRPTEHAATPPAPTPMATPSTTASPSAAVTPSATATAGTPTPTRTPTSTPTATPVLVDVRDFVGAYDATFESDDVIAEVFVDDDGKIGVALYFNGHTAVGMTGEPRSDGHVSLEGEGRLEDDIVFSARGTATFIETPTKQQVRGSVHKLDMQFGFEGDFVLERPVHRPPSKLDGSYEFAFDPSPGGCGCTTTATFTLATDENGIGNMVAAADELDASAARQGTFHPSSCDVTVSGRMRCVFGYETTFTSNPSEAHFPVTLTGTLAAGSGRGRTEAPIFPHAFFLGGDWTATRVGP